MVAAIDFFDKETGSTGTNAFMYHTIADFVDLFSGTGTEDGSDPFGTASDERIVHSIRNPNMRVGAIRSPDTGEIIDWEPRVYDDGIELGVYWRELDPDNQPGVTTKTKIYNSQVMTGTSLDGEYINLAVEPFGQIGISGESIHGTNVKDFFDFVSRKLNEEKENFLTEASFAVTKFNESTDLWKDEFSLPVYHDGDITVLEMAEKVAKATNFIFYFKYILDESGVIKREVNVVDLNYAYEATQELKTISHNEIVSISIEFPYPIKAFESSYTRNEFYFGEFSQERGSQMKKVTSTFREGGSGVGTVQNYELFMDNISEGRKWLKRLSITEGLPKASIAYNGIDRDIVIGSKIAFLDIFRKLKGFLIVQEVKYNFQNESTNISGISKFEEIVYS